MRTRSRWVATVSGLSLTLTLGALVHAAPNANAIADGVADAEMKAQLEAQEAAGDCQNVPDSPGLMPAWYAERCVPATTTSAESSLAPDVAPGPILMQETSTNTVRFSSVAGIATTTSFGALVPPSATDFPADFVRLSTDLTHVYQLTSSGAVSRYTQYGSNTVLTPIPPAAGLTWSDTATDPTTGDVYGSAVTSNCSSSTLSRLDLVAGTRVAVGPITGGGCVISLAADNAGNLFGIDIAADNLIAISKVNGAPTVVGPLGFNANFAQAFDCDPSTNTCYMFTINFNTGSRDLRSVNTSTGATTLVGNIGTTSPGGTIQVAGAVFQAITCATDADCQDDDLCNGVETCVATECTPGPAVDCSDGLFCTLDNCNPATGACTNPPNPCGDGDTCTVDACDEVGDACNHSTPTPIRICTTGTINIPSSGVAFPYPSTLAVQVAGTSGGLCSVELLQVVHSRPSDIDVLLVGPVATTQNATIMSDVSSGIVAPPSNASVTLKDAAAASLPASGSLVSGTFKPTNLGGTDTFPSPAPVALGGSSLAAFSGNANGTWSLYVVDDLGSQSGSIAQWCLNIVPTPSCATDPDCNDANLCTDDVCSNSMCVNTNNTAACSDGNVCTENDTCSGGVCVPGPAQTAPGEVQNVLGFADKATYNWSSTACATQYDVLRGNVSALPVGPGGGDETCLADRVVQNVNDPFVPAAGQAVFYLVRAQNAFGNGTYGTQGVSGLAGAPRGTTTCP